MEVTERARAGWKAHMVTVWNVCALTPQCFPYIYIYLTLAVGVRPAQVPGLSQPALCFQSHEDSPHLFMSSLTAQSEASGGWWDEHPQKWALFAACISD